MAQLEQQRRAQFLQEAAHLLAVPSPAAASFLGRARDQVVRDAELEIAPKEVDAYRRSICGACGNVMIPGWSCITSIRSQSRGGGSQKGKDSKKVNIAPERKTALECLRCHRETIQTLPPKPPRRIRRSRAHAQPEPAAEVTVSRKLADNAAMKTANATSKQRQKARKGGLQAMLEKSKTQNTGTGGFDLMDFAM
ncbi:hypothetical protein IAQ61_006159 [Plenodomus lingam]|uniref:Uncharacterized protein n=1 Tax=Leptosphaeria maculans (strain JN3 / isolate v23.1.3 / race Av1-4-5-6-7-8) TaxID=985895 RepID=E4ZM95_LEPMJ|nr:hypothetical protein LEMA_P051500.1 [Plenodomus lingam JN3]KAH9870681.1 hypothetical protein IAQ61_006159 [Plenodomus lingam]CBX92444.1 hypothetical protein LEMA_P051500.1 [Plenodomus lingam JN3]